MVVLLLADLMPIMKAAFCAHRVLRDGTLRMGAFYFGSGCVGLTQMNVMSTGAPFAISDPVNARILAVSEDKVQGFQRNPLRVIAEQSGLEINVVVERIQAMLRAGTIRRVR